jgi:hypothetical protein
VQVPTSDALPEIRAWMPTDAQLTWTYKRKTEKVKNSLGQTKEVEVRFFVVNAFERKLKTNYKGPRDAATAPKSILQKIQELFSTGHPRAPPSGANPSNLVGKQVETEDDILHIKKLPDFNGAITQQNSELLLQFLTVPCVFVRVVVDAHSDPTAAATPSLPSNTTTTTATGHQQLHQTTPPQPPPPPPGTCASRWCCSSLRRRSTPRR